MSGVTSRTLRYYDEIGLLPPARAGANGYRYYEREQLLRLQQIMLLRELGLGLATIAKVLAGEADMAVSLQRHREWLLAERDRIDQLVHTMDATLADLELAKAGGENGDQAMKAEELFEGFDPARQARYEAELVERYGPDVREHIDESWRRIDTWTRQDADAVGKGFVDVEKRLTALLVEGATVDEPRVLDVVAEHYEIVKKFWTPNAEQYAGLGELYVEHPDFRARYDAHHPRLAEFLRDAIAAYAFRTPGLGLA
jgi:DNA-binding transcriptional MerR regulator